LLEDDVFVDEFDEEAVQDRARIDLSRKIRVVADPTITALGSKFRHKVRVEIHLRDGSVLGETRVAPRGSEESFAPAADIVEKFRKLTQSAMPRDQQDALIEAVLGVENLVDSKELIRLLHVGGSSQGRGHDVRRSPSVREGVKDAR
jgi:2-methylcitrate dehydratase PrpD